MALGYVYRQGLIHRDVKPANLLTVLNNGQITDVKITDFGSVLNLGSDVTQIHRVGSLAYMSPEQLDGGTLDCRADIYSLGAVLYHLIAGRPLFDAQVQSAMMHQIYNVRPASLAGVRAGVSEALDGVIQKALAKKPGDRYSDWGEFAQALVEPGDDRSRCRAASSRACSTRSASPCCARSSSSPTSATSSCGRWCTAPVAALPLRPCPLSQGRGRQHLHIMAQGEVEVFRDGKKVAQLGAGTSVGEMAYLAPSAELKKHSTDVIITEPTTTISFTPETLLQLSPNCRHLFHDSFIKVLVRACTRRTSSWRIPAGSSSALAHLPADAGFRTGRSVIQSRQRPARSRCIRSETSHESPALPRRCPHARRLDVAFANAHKEAPAMGASAPMAGGRLVRHRGGREEARRRGEDELHQEVRGRRVERLRSAGRREEAGRRGQDELHQEVRGRRPGP
jgi:hypothetical protein